MAASNPGVTARSVATLPTKPGQLLPGLEQGPGPVLAAQADGQGVDPGPQPGLLGPQLADGFGELHDPLVRRRRQPRRRPRGPRPGRPLRCPGRRPTPAVRRSPSAPAHCVPRRRPPRRPAGSPRRRPRTAATGPPAPGRTAGPGPRGGRRSPGRHGRPRPRRPAVRVPARRGARPRCPPRPGRSPTPRRGPRVRPRPGRRPRRVRRDRARCRRRTAGRTGSWPVPRPARSFPGTARRARTARTRRPAPPAAAG